MHSHSLRPWQHDHTFGQEIRRPAERRTLAVVVLTAATMLVEIVSGLVFGSMALLADGLHMGSHAAALGLSVAAYVYARRHAADRRFSFGTGKVGALAGYSSALLLAAIALLMAAESVGRLLTPQPIDFDQALLVAVLGLVVNGASLRILHGTDAGASAFTAGHGHGRAHPHAQSHGHSHGHDDGNEHPAGPAAAHSADHNFRGAYLHVLADALTSLLAIAALGSGAVLGWLWPDAAVGLLGSLLVGRWAWGLVRDSAGVLLDRDAPLHLQERVRRAIEADGDARVADLHVWSVGTTGYAAALSVVAHAPRTADDYRAALPDGIVHATIEIHHCAG